MTYSTECRYYEDCQRRNDELWGLQKQRNGANDELFRRWGAWKDEITTALAECRSDIIKSRDSSKQIEAALELMQEQSRQYMDGTTKVLAELAESIRSSREATEQNHAELMAAVVANAALATRAVDRADAAAARADGAQKAAGESAGKLSTMTRATLAGWGMAIAAAGAFFVHIMTEYGWPWLRAWLKGL